MVINEEEKNAFTQSVMGDTEGGGGGEGGAAVYVAYDNETGVLDATFNELVEYFNNGKLVFTSVMYEDDGTEYHNWWILTMLQRVPNGSSVSYLAYFTFFSFYDGAAHLGSFVLYTSDPDENMFAD